MEKTRRRGRRNARVHLDLEVIRYLPTEIIVGILTRLPLKSLSRFRLVCKSWYNTITHTGFANAQFLASFHHNSPCVLISYNSKFALVDLADHKICVEAVNLNLKEFEPTFRGNSFGILGSIHGLVCFCTSRSRSHVKIDDMPRLFYICNPITQEHVILPKSPKCGMTHDVAGFGYDSSTNQYKVIRILSITDEAEIYTLGSDRWRKIENVPYVDTGKILEGGVFVNGSLHWLTKWYVGIPVNLTFVILSFDLTTENFGIIGLPPAVISFPSVIENQLCIVMEKFNYEIHIWVMTEYGVEESWRRQYVFQDHIFSVTFVGPFEIMKAKNGELLLWGFKVKKRARPRPEPFCTKYLHYSDSQNKRPIKIQTALPYWEPFVFRGSLLSPKCIESSTDSRNNQSGNVPAYE